MSSGVPEPRYSAACHLLFDLPNRNFELAELDFVLILDLDQRIASILKIWIALRKNERVPEHPSPEPKALVELA